MFSPTPAPADAHPDSAYPDSLEVVPDSHPDTADSETAQVVADAHADRARGDADHVVSYSAADAADKRAAHVLMHSGTDDAERDALEPVGTSGGEAKCETANRSAILLVGHPARDVDSVDFLHPPVAIVDAETCNASRIANAYSDIVDCEVE
jgi:hypothetical protein